MSSNKENLISEILILLSEIVNNHPGEETLEWYLLNYLKRYLEVINESESSEEIKKSSQIFSRFCMESMNWDSELFKRCSKLGNSGFKISNSM